MSSKGVTGLVLVFVAYLVAAPAVSAQPEVERLSLDPGPDRVAVFPFDNISGVQSDDWIGAGIAETLAVEFQNRSALDVVAGDRVAETLRFADTPDTSPVEHGPILEIGRRLGARWVTSGSYQRLRDQLRITAQLFDTGTGSVVVAATVDGVINDLFGLQDQLAAELADGATADSRRASAPSSPRGSGARPSVDTDMATEGSVPASPVRRGPAPTRSPAAVTASQIATGPGAGAPGDSESAGLFLEPAAVSLAPSERYRVEPRRVEQAPQLDGSLDEEAWLHAAVIDEFIQQEPSEGDPATERTVRQTHV